MNYKRLSTIYDKLKRNEFLFQSSLYILRSTGRRYLNVRIDTTNFCNLRCKMCYLSMDSNHKRLKMEKKIFDQIADKFFSKTKMLYLSCGAEPLVNPDFTYFMDSSSVYGVPFRSFATNGMLLGKKVIDSCVDNGIEEVIVSLDGSTKKTVESIRIGSDFERIVDNLTALDETVSNSNKKLPRIRINFTLMRSNFYELENTIRYFSELKNVYIIDIRHMRIHEGLKMDGEILTLNHQKEYTNVIRRMERFCKAKNIILQYPQKCFVNSLPAAKKHFCPIPFFSVYVDSKGQIRLCPYVDKGIPITDFNLIRKKLIKEYLDKHSPNCSICETND